jgi:hypothetical protein
MALSSRGIAEGLRSDLPAKPLRTWQLPTRDFGRYGCVRRKCPISAQRLRDRLASTRGRIAYSAL